MQLEAFISPKEFSINIRDVNLLQVRKSTVFSGSFGEIHWLMRFWRSSVPSGKRYSMLRRTRELPSPNHISCDTKEAGENVVDGLRRDDNPGADNASGRMNLRIRAKQDVIEH